MEKDILKLKMDKLISDVNLFTSNHPFVKEFKSLPDEKRIKALADLIEIYANEIESVFNSGSDLFQIINYYLIKKDFQHRKN